MNRRNFILGLGTAATLSGAASVTGAALSNTVDAGANFQIVATNQLNVQRNDELENSDDIFDSSNGNYSDQNGTFEKDYTDISTSSFPNLTVDDERNDALNMSLATGNDNESQYNRNGTFLADLEDTQAYNGSAGAGRVAPLEVVNEGGSSQDVGITFNYGSDVGGSSVSKGDVATIFEFEIDGVQVSPDDANPDTESNAVTIAAGGSREVDLTLNYNANLEEKVSNAASGGSDFGFGSGNSSSASADLLNSVVIGTSDGGAGSVQDPSKL